MTVQTEAEWRVESPGRGGLVDFIKTGEEWRSLVPRGSGFLLPEEKVPGIRWVEFSLSRNKWISSDWIFLTVSWRLEHLQKSD